MDATNAESSVEDRKRRLAARASEPWPRLLLRLAVTVGLIFAAGAVVVAVSGR